MKTWTEFKLHTRIRFRGGSANLKYLFVDNPNGRGMRIEKGFSGYIQHVIAAYTSNPSSAVTLLEIYDPESHPILSNVTLMSVGDTFNNSRGIRLRDGAHGEIYNAIVTKTRRGVRADSGLSSEIINEDLVFSYGHVWDNSQYDYQLDGELFSSQSSFHNSSDPINMDKYMTIEKVEGFSINAYNNWFDDSSYVGGIVKNDDWLSSWAK